ncbi:MAG: isoaspartyl peptidase/L-asparaginase [Bacteroidales bacterium]|nr:isoaspartyl peptidase/L-asparaginase [Bacteroidales bacterium]
MKVTFLLFLSCLFLYACQTKPQKKQIHYSYALIIHGGAGSMDTVNLKETDQIAYKAALDTALQKGISTLASGKSSLDAVCQVIEYLENNPMFNAGRGAVFTHEGKNELDASIMSGLDLSAGAVAGVRDVKNPILLARKIMDNSKHVMLSGKGASEFARENGLEMADSSWFFTEKSYNNLIKAIDNEKLSGLTTPPLPDYKYGTVGCVALDQGGNLAAGTSTGGMTNKQYGRIGDSPIIGAGTYANNKTCGVSATGHGEFFIRYTVAHDISALMEYKGMGVEEAANEVINNKLTPVDGSGGVVCLDKNGNYAMVFNTSGMFRAYGNSEGQKIIRIFK